MRTLHFVFVFSALLAGLFLTVSTQSAYAQWGVGVSFELRDENPEDGFGLRVERRVFQQLPVVQFNMRAHFSYFRDTETISFFTPGDPLQTDTELETFDFGLGLTGGIPIGLIFPYVGLGLGLDDTSFDADMVFRDDAGNALSPEPFSQTDFYWNLFVGGEISVLPFLKPFIEYRFTDIANRGDVTPDTVNRVSIGVNVRF
ncbi:MAG: outer membrane protein [Balneolaceae bacterium]